MAVTVETLLSYFDESRFIPVLRSTTKAGALREIIEALSEDPEIRHPDVLREALEAREKLGSTGIGKEVAIPHGRTLSVPRLKVLVARSKKGIAWGSADEKPVKLFFVVVAPPLEKTNEYLPLLGMLVAAMQEKQHRDHVLKSKTFADVKEALRGALRG
jgi:mannitol/fructose-specific phosphotransferase system IIA component (Ntr-type)